MKIQESAENYLETIYRLSRDNPHVRSIDVAEALGYSRPSVSRAVGLLKRDGYLQMDQDSALVLTDSGKAIAEKIFERHTVLTTALVSLGVDRETAAEDACRIEHVISEESFEAIKHHAASYGRKS